MDTKQKIESVVIFFFMLVIGAFLLASNHTETSAEFMTRGQMDIIETAKAVGKFNTLISALESAGLAETLKGQGPFTVFAPTDQAFAKLPEATLDEILLPENKKKLAGILKHHVVKKIILLRGRGFRSLDNTRLTINNLGEITINDARIEARNIPASNGIIHVIDTVLLPDDAEHSRTAIRIIKEAIELGVPLYNCDNAKACSVVYRSALSDLLGLPNGTFSEDARGWITRMFIYASDNDDPRERSWAFRSILDSILAELEHKEVISE